MPASTPGAKSFALLEAANEGPAVMKAFAAIRPTDHAKYLLTSGSTGIPKVVINTHRMLCANQQQIAQVWPFLMRHPLVLVDWLPWSHTFGGNHNFHMVLSHGGTLYIDEGRPAPGLIERRCATCARSSPTSISTCRAASTCCCRSSKQDLDTARNIFERLEGIFYAAAALPQSLWQRLEAVARNVRRAARCGSRPPGAPPKPRLRSRRCIGGSTTPAASALPLPGAELKFVPNGDKLEMRVRGPNIFPGYLRHKTLTADAFDDEGFYQIGDAGKLVNRRRPVAGRRFQRPRGRGLQALQRHLGQRRHAAAAHRVGDGAARGRRRDRRPRPHRHRPAGVPDAAGQGTAAGRAADRMCSTRCARVRAEGGGSSQCPVRAIIQEAPPSADAGEITDKGYINQRAVLEHRAADVAALYEKADPRVIRLA